MLAQHRVIYIKIYKTIVNVDLHILHGIQITLVSVERYHMVLITAHQCKPCHALGKQYRCKLTARTSVIVIYLYDIVVIHTSNHNKWYSSVLPIRRWRIIHKCSSKHHSINLVILNYSLKLTHIIRRNCTHQHIIVHRSCHLKQSHKTFLEERQIHHAVVARHDPSYIIGF